jgi:hypothetical protein
MRRTWALAVNPNVIIKTIIIENIPLIVRRLIIIRKHESIPETQHFLYQIFASIISSQIHVGFILPNNFAQSQKWKSFTQKSQIPTLKGTIK